MSRAISDNLQCGLTRDHPISREWAKSIPPLQDNFAVTRDVLFKFLTQPLQPEIQDIYNREHRKLMEPKTVQENYNDSLNVTPEQKFYCGIKMLEQFNDQYLRSWASTKVTQSNEYCDYLSQAKLLHDERRKELMFEKVKEIVDRFYKNSSDKMLYKKIMANLKEVAVQLIRNKNEPLDSVQAEKLDDSVEKLMNYLHTADKNRIQKNVDKKVKDDILKVNTVDLLDNDEQPVVKFQLSSKVIFQPKICNLSNGWDLPLQEECVLEPMEFKKVDLGVKIILPQSYCAFLMNKSSARVKYGVHVFLGLIDVGFHNFLQMVIQNVTDKKVTLPAGTAVSQLLVIKSRIPKFELGWEELESRNGSFGSTGQNFEKVVAANQCHVIKETLDSTAVSTVRALDVLNPYNFSMENLNINLLGSNEKRVQELTELLDFEKRNFSSCNLVISKLPYVECNNLNFVNDEKVESGSELPPLSEADKAALLVSDLCENRKLSLEVFIELQDNDINIRKVKENLVECTDSRKLVFLFTFCYCRSRKSGLTTFT